MPDPMTSAEIKPTTLAEYCQWCDETVRLEEAWCDEWESFGLRCSECGAWFRSY